MCDFGGPVTISATECCFEGPVTISAADFSLISCSCRGVANFTDDKVDWVLKEIQFFRVLAKKQ